MSVPDVSPEVIRALQQAEFHTQDYLAVAASYCRRLGLIETINTLVPSHMHVSPGEVVQAMVLDTLSGRTPLYRLSESMAGTDVELLLGKAIDPKMLNDLCLGRTLDALYDAGTSRIITALGVRAVRDFELRTDRVHYDTTSTSVWGDYRESESGPPQEGPRITYGHSKDARPDLKQFLTECLCVEGGVPILARARDGNASDKVLNNELLSRLRSTMHQHGLSPRAYIYIADSAAVTEGNLNEAAEHRFISRLPFSYNECERIVAVVVAMNQWHEIGALAEDTSPGTRKAAAYKVAEGEVQLYGRTWRAVVVHSSAHDKRRLKKLEKELSTSQKDLLRQAENVQKIFFCRPDAEAAADAVAKFRAPLHRSSAKISEHCKRGRGRPSADGTGPMKTVYELELRIEEREDEVARRRAVAGCFVLITNVPETGAAAPLSGGDILKTYKEQNSVEMNFAFLKDPLIVNDLFLKKASRIEALGMILIIALMVWRLMEVAMRRHLQHTGKPITGWAGRPTEKPTAFMMSTKIARIQTVKLPGSGGRHFLSALTDVQLEYLEALQVTPDVFLNPRAMCLPAPQNHHPPSFKR